MAPEECGGRSTRGQPAIGRYVPVVPGMLLATLIAAWALLRRRRPHAVLGFPLLLLPTVLMLFGPVDVSVSPRARLGVRLVPVVYGLLTVSGREGARSGEFQSRGCIVPAYPKRWTVEIGYRLPSPGEWGSGLEPMLEVDEMEATLGEVRIASKVDSFEH